MNDNIIINIHNLYENNYIYKYIIYNILCQYNMYIYEGPLDNGRQLYLLSYI